MSWQWLLSAIRAHLRLGVTEVSLLETRIVGTSSVEPLGRFWKASLMVSDCGQQQGQGAALIWNSSEDSGVQQL